MKRENKNLKIVFCLVAFLLLLPFLPAPVQASAPTEDKEPGIKVDSHTGIVEVKKGEWTRYDTFDEEKIFSGQIPSQLLEVSSAWKLAARLHGKVESQKREEVGWSPIWQARVLRDGDSVRTLDNSYLKIVLPDYTFVIVEPNTVVELKDFKPVKRSLVFKLKLVYGTVKSEIKKFMGKDASHEITTPNGAIAARGTEFEVKVDDEKTTVSLYEGELEITSFYDNKIFILKDSQQAVLWENKPADISQLVDQEPLEIVMAEPCSIPDKIDLTDSRTVEYTYDDVGNLVGVTDANRSVSYQTEPCIVSPRARMLFFTNKILDSSTVNGSTFIVMDEEGLPVDGFYEVGSTITFIPSRPLFGKIKVTLKGGSNGIRSKTGICLDEDYVLELNGTKKTLDFEEGVDFELTSTVPLKVDKLIILNNAGETTARDIVLSTPSFKTYFPNSFVKFDGISPDLPYEIKEEGENSAIEFKIDELKPHESLTIDISYNTLLFGRRYFQRLDVSNCKDYENISLVESYTKPGEGIESDDQIIINLSREIVGNEKNPFWKAYKIYDWITKTIRYDHDLVPSGGALATIEKGEGVCGDYAKLFMALARAAGIPSRYIILYVLDNYDVEAHASVEIYLPEYGWVPIDPTWGVEFNNFARQYSLLLPEFKEDGISKSYLYHLHGTNIENVEVNVSVDMSVLDLKTESSWIDSFGESFFKNMYELVLLSEIRGELDYLDRYNAHLDEDLFEVPKILKEDSIILIKNAIEAYKNNEYESIENDVDNSIKEHLVAISAPLSSLAQQSRDYLSNKTYTFYEKTVPVITDQIEYKTFDYDGALLELSNIIDEIHLVSNLLEENNHFEALNKFIEIYKTSRCFIDSMADDVYSEHCNPLILPEIDDMLDIPPEFIPELSVPPPSTSEFVYVISTLIVFVLLFIFWISMLIICLLRKEFRHLNKVSWFFIILILNFLGAVPYLILELIIGGTTKTRNLADSPRHPTSKKDVK